MQRLHRQKEEQWSGAIANSATGELECTREAGRGDAVDGRKAQKSGENEEARSKQGTAVALQG